ncbi:PREDICTED: uncharacterized protein LOC101381027 [Odobenus rosmarus divergens]|uniref:Uncharacterized protein LOC101381027 n=1 Tax=Odobenus rosmarus divergens TaxID=9708 RepID=A0A9B0G825_ODORO
MTPGDRRPWLPVALLLLQVPGCWCLSGPTSVTGTVGGSLSVQCQYEEKFREIAKYWCKSPCLGDIVKIEKSDKEVRNGRVSIRNHPANLTFTVTLENLTEGDAGTYRCGIDTSWLPGYMIDLTFRVVVSVTPGELWTPLPQCQHQGCLRLGLITPTPAGKWWGVGKQGAGWLSPEPLLFPHTLTCPGEQDDSASEIALLARVHLEKGPGEGLSASQTGCGCGGMWSQDICPDGLSDQDQPQDMGTKTGGLWREPGRLPEDVAHCLSPWPPQFPVQQDLLLAPGLPGGAPAPEHAQCCPLSEQASEGLWGQVTSTQ